jgi:hypothetical protein
MVPTPPTGQAHVAMVGGCSAAPAAPAKSCQVRHAALGADGTWRLCLQGYFWATSNMGWIGLKSFHAHAWCMHVMPPQTAHANAF